MIINHNPPILSKMVADPQGDLRCCTGCRRCSTICRMDIPATAKAALLEQQQGVLTRAQALSLGWTDRFIEFRVSQGRWQRLYSGVYATFSGAPSRSCSLWAALLRAGEGAALSHWTAAELWGLVSQPAEAVHVTVPAERY